MEDVCAISVAYAARSVSVVWRARSGSFGTDCESGAGSWLKDPITNCAVWGSDLSGDNLISWSGDCRDGKANGTGVLSWTK